jgi:eukaryotic-like serine/threonine-protein kinase
MGHGEKYRFGSFEVRTSTRELSKSGTKIKLRGQPYLILEVLLSRAGEVVTREEIRQKLWPADTFVDFEHGLNSSVKKLRQVLCDSAQEPRYIETLPRLGYRFIAPVEIVTETSTQSAEEGRTFSAEELGQAIMGAAGLDPENPQACVQLDGATAQSVPEQLINRAGPWHPLPRWWLLVGGLLAILLGAASVRELQLHRAHQTKRLKDEDTIVLADFANTTGEPVFDNTLKTALTVSLRQSPFLNVLSDHKVAATLKLMTRLPNTKLSPDVTRELCLRVGSKAYIAGSIASLGSQYVLDAKVVNCQSGDVLQQEEATAASKEKVLDALGDLASKLRGQLGESLPTIQKFDVPLAEATTASLEALEAYSLGSKASLEKGPSAALPYHLRAIELDPNFAVAYVALGNDYYALGELGRAREYRSKAFQLREHASEQEKLQITANYYETVTGELNEAAKTYQEWMASYPRSTTPLVNTCNLYNELGQYDKAIDACRESFRLGSQWGYVQLTNGLLALNRLDEAQKAVQEAQSRKLDNFILRSALYALAFLKADSTSMAEEQQWFAGKPEENFGLSLASDTEAYVGHLRKARELSRRSVDSAIRADSKEVAAIWLENSALREAALGNARDVRQQAAEGLKLHPESQSVELEAALALAMVGAPGQAESLAGDLNKRFPLDTQVQSLWLPAIRAQLALNRGNPIDALNDLQASTPIELGQIAFIANLSCLYHTYIRGEAYLAAGQGKEAAAEFQKILDHNGIVWNCWTGALAHLGVARANALQSKTSQVADADAARVRALAAYKDFLTLWKDADPDIPILKQAKAEYAKLQ